MKRVQKGGAAAQEAENSMKKSINLCSHLDSFSYCYPQKKRREISIMDSYEGHGFLNRIGVVEDEEDRQSVTPTNLSKTTIQKGKILSNKRRTFENFYLFNILFSIRCGPLTLLGSEGK